MIKPRLNHQIRSLEVRVVDPPLGVLTHSAAMAFAAEEGLDLIEITPGATPPVCIIKELGKWKYEQAKKTKGMKQFVQEIKQIQIRPVTDVGDLTIKAKQAREFLEEGHRVRLVVRFRGRELANPEVGEDTLQRLIDAIDCEVETRSGLDGKQIIVTVKAK